MKLLGPAAVAAALSLSTGCFWATEKSEAVWGYSGRAMLADDGHVDGGVVDVQGGGAGLYFGLEGNLRDVARPEDVETSTALGFAVTAKASLFGILGNRHELDRFLDLGGEVGGGGVLIPDSPRTPNPLAAGAGYYGAWVELGTFAVGKGGYLAIVGDVRREAFGSPWSDQTELTVGLAWRHREPLGPLNFHD